MGLPRGLTNLTVHLQTPDERQAQREAADRRDWATVEDLKPAFVLHFGKRQVRLATTTRSIARAGREITEIQREIDEGRMYVETPKFDARPTAWAQLGSLPFDD